VINGIATLYKASAERLYSSRYSAQRSNERIGHNMDASQYAVAPHQHKEGHVTKAIEHVTSQVPSGVYLSLAIASIGLSAGLQCIGRKHAASFVGHWAPTILILGLYNKMVKVHGSE
jgi:hypothetical protein